MGALKEMRIVRGASLAILLLIATIVVVTWVSQDVILEEGREEKSPSKTSVSALHQLVMTRSEDRYKAEQAARAKRLNLHHQNHCQRLIAHAARDTHTANKFAVFAKQYEMHCLRFKYSCKRNRIYKAIVKNYVKHAAAWQKQIAKLKCKT